jgi:hypothetical protein
MKRIDEELGDSEPKGLHNIFECGSLRLHIAFGAEMVDFLFSVLIHDAVVHTFLTIIYLATGANPMGLLGGMIVTKSGHVSSSLSQI